VGPGVLAGLGERIGERSAFVVVDARVEHLHAERLKGALGDRPRRTVTAGEDAKTPAELEGALEALGDAGLGRDGVVVAIGGGAACDLAGLTAALFARGIDWIACPTTLLAMIDASVGGKTAINLRAGKNLAGAFHAPRAVLADVEFLATLPPDEMRSGLGELAKAALVEGGELLAELSAAAPGLAGGERAPGVDLIARAVAAKARVVAADEREAGPREALNLGHTFAHAIEHVLGYGRVPHGVAVAAGIGLALDAAERLEPAPPARFPQRARALLAALGLPAGLDALARELGLDRESALAPDALIRAMRGDKKRRAGTTRLVLPLGPGEVRRGVEVDEPFLRAVLAGR